MKLKDLFMTKPQRTAQPDERQTIAPNTTLDLDALDDCVGGRAETDGVGCYVNFTQPSAH